MVHAGARPLFLSPSVSVTACAGGRLACDASERRRGRSPDDCSSRIAITRSVDVQLTVSATLHMHHALSGTAEDGPASGEHQERAQREEDTCPNVNAVLTLSTGGAAGGVRERNPSGRESALRGGAAIRRAPGRERLGWPVDEDTHAGFGGQSTCWTGRPTWCCNESASMPSS